MIVMFLALCGIVSLVNSPPPSFLMLSAAAAAAAMAVGSKWKPSDSKVIERSRFSYCSSLHSYLHTVIS